LHFYLFEILKLPPILSGGFDVIFWQNSLPLNDNIRNKKLLNRIKKLYPTL